MRLASLQPFLPLLAAVFLIACEQGPKQTKGTPPLTETETEAPPVVEESIVVEEVDPARTAAMEECWSYANSQVKSDAVIDNDIYGGRNQGIGGDFSVVRTQMRPYVYEQRRKELFDSCLSGRGFTIE